MPDGALVGAQLQQKPATRPDRSRDRRRRDSFVAPLHWGFVFFGWMALGVFGVILQILNRVKELLGKEGVALLTE